MRRSVRPRCAGASDVAVDNASLYAWLREFATAVAASSQHLTELDAAVGDADHGINMERATAAVAKSAPEPGQTVAAYLKHVALELVQTTGGASGPLFGTLFLRMASAAGDVDSLDAAGFAAALRAGVDGVGARGKSAPGDKTMIDALAPAADALEKSLAQGDSLSVALSAASVAADAGRDATIDLLARRGRASYLGERSIGHQDPGATSVLFMVQMLAAAAKE